MTQEQKARAYDEALTTAKRIISKNCSEVEKLCLKCVFPELAESEDERHRKWILECLYDGLRKADDQFKEQFKSAIAWLEKQKKLFESGRGLYYYDGEKTTYCGYPATEENPYDFAISQQEKQKEQKPAEINEYEIIKKHITDDSLSSEVNKRLKECGWYVTDEKPAERNESDTLMCNAALELLRSHPNLMASNGINKSSIIRWLQSFRPQRQGFIDDICSKAGISIPYLDGNQWCILKGDNIQSGVVGFGDTKEDALANFIKDVPIQQKWGEEDEDMLNSCISSIEEAKENRYAYKETDGDTSYDHEIAWLKSLRPQPKQEWSKEDEEMYARVVRRYTDYEGLILRTKEESVANKMLDAMAQEEIWLKSIHSQPQWKPTNQHMEALRLSFEEALDDAGDCNRYRELKSLYEQLKKLM